MSQKKPTPFPFEQHSSSSDDEEEEFSGEEEATPLEQQNSSADDEETSSGEEEVESESEEEEEPNVTPVPPVKPVQSPKVTQKQQQPDLAPATAPASAVTVGKKRLGEESKAVSKKFKNKRVAEEVVKKVGDYPKTPPFQRVFSEDDEIAMLKALFDYSAAKFIDPIEFHDFVKKYIHVDVTRAQLSAKIKKMKSKYKKNASNTKETFVKTHQTCYDLSKKIWGKSSSGCGGSELKRTLKPNMTSDRKEKHASSLQKEEPVSENSSSLFCLTELAKTKDVVGMMGLSDDLLKKGFELLNDEARAALEEKWNNIATAELEIYYNRLELSREHVKLSLDALKASGHRG